MGMNDNNTVKEAISQFILSTSSKTVESPKKRYIKKSYIVNRQSSNPSNSEIILDLKGTGELREISIISPKKMNPYLIIDGVDTLDSINSWDQLAQITLYTTTIVAQTNGTDFILSFNKIHFTHELILRITFDSKGTISRAFGVYDLCEGR